MIRKKTTDPRSLYNNDPARIYTEFFEILGFNIGTFIFNHSIYFCKLY